MCKSGDSLAWERTSYPTYSPFTTSAGDNVKMEKGAGAQTREEASKLAIIVNLTTWNIFLLYEVVVRVGFTRERNASDTRRCSVRARKYAVKNREVSRRVTAVSPLQTFSDSVFSAAAYVIKEHVA